MSIINNSAKYILVYFLIALNSMPFWVGDIYFYVFLTVACIIFLFQNFKIDEKIYHYILLFSIIMIFQIIIFRVPPSGFLTLFSYIAKILYAYTTIKIVGPEIDNYYIKIMYVFTIISLFLFSFQLLAPGISFNLFDKLYDFIFHFQLKDPGRKHIIIYTYGAYYEHLGQQISRNSGPFWEPGGFGIYLLIALYFNIVRENKFFNRKNIIFILGIITTLSTAIYIAFFAFLLTYVLYRYKHGAIFVYIVTIILIIPIYTGLFFLQNKISDQLSALNGNLEYAPRNRFVSAMLDINEFIKEPVLGKGMFAQTRFQTVEKVDIQENWRNNGVTNMLVDFGIIGFVYFWFNMYKSSKLYCKMHNHKKSLAFIFLIIMFLSGMSQQIFIKPFFIGLSFMFLINFKNTSRYSRTIKI